MIVFFRYCYLGVNVEVRGICGRGSGVLSSGSHKREILVLCKNDKHYRTQSVPCALNVCQFVLVENDGLSLYTKDYDTGFIS